MAQQDEGDNKWKISPVEFSSYYTYYHRITPTGNLLSGARARDFFLQTKLPPQTLSRVWRLADLDNDGCLNPAEFAVAMHLIQVCLKDPTGDPPLPTSCPAPLQSTVQQTLYPQLPVANQAHLMKCRNAFGAFYENVGKGVLGGDAARYLMLKSNLSKPQLFHIWKLSDIDQDGRLTFVEFTIAMQLIFIAKLGYTLPVDLDPNTILPPSFYQVKKEVQIESERLPKTTPTTEPPEPFSPPGTPGHQIQPSFFGENPFISDAFVNLPAKQFREGNYDNFIGDPFETMDPFSNEGAHNISVESDDFVESTNPPEVLQNGHKSVTPDSSLSTDSLRSLEERQPTSNSDVSLSYLSQTEQERVGQPSPSLDHTLSQSSYSQTSSKESLQLKEDGYSLNSRSPVVSSQESLESSNLSRGNVSERGTGSQPDLSQQSGGSYRESQDSLSSSPRLKNSRRSGRSSAASFQEVVVVESTEPVLQLATAVDVIGSREVTPIPDDLPPDTVTVQLESLSKESRKLVAESQNILEEQQQKNLPYMVMPPEEYRRASVNGLTATIKEIEEPGTLNETPEPVKPVLKPIVQDQIPCDEEEIDFDDDLTTSDVMSQLDDLEAEMMSTLDDADFDLDQFDDEDVPIDYDQIEVGAIDLENPNLTLPSDSIIDDSDRQTPGPDDDIDYRTASSATPTREASNDLSEEQDESPVVVRRENRGVRISQERQEAKQRRSVFLEAAMDELDNFMEGELADINDMFEEFQTKDKKSEQRLKTEEKELEKVQLKDVPVVVPLVGDLAESVEKITKRRDLESQKIAEEWEHEMQRLEEERLKTLQQQDVTAINEVESDTFVQNLDAELQSLIKHEEEAVKIAQREKELLAQREKEEAERKERERKEKLERMSADNQEELTIEEWIEWMEEKKKQGMTPEQLEELQKRRAAWLVREKQREEKRKRIEEEQLAKTRKKMESELIAIRERDMEIKSSRLTEEELEAKKREKALQHEQESQLRKERSKQAREDMKQREMEELKPKAKSALAARWEERIRARSDGKVTREENRATVLSGKGKDFASSQREEQRITRRISNGSRPLSTSNGESLGVETSPVQDKRHSMA